MISIAAGLGAFLTSLVLLFPTECYVGSHIGAASTCESLTGVSYGTMTIGATNALILAALAGCAAGILAALLRDGATHLRERSLTRRIGRRDA